MMTMIALPPLSSSPKTLSVLSSSSTNPHLNPNPKPKNPRRLQNLLLGSIAGALAFTIVSSPPLPSLASNPPAMDPSLCVEESSTEAMEDERPSESITNEEIVEEAWEVINDSYVGDVGSRPWSPEIWKKEKDYVLSGKIQTRARAHDAIRKSGHCWDPYYEILSPAEFSKMARYDVSGIGINLREIPDNNGAVRLKVLGIILDGPAHSAGVRQGDELLSVNGVDVKGKSAFDVSTMLQGPKETFVTIEVKHGTCGPTQSIKVQRQSIARTPIFYRLEKMENGNVSVGYIHIKEFNALARKDLITALRRLQESGASYFVLDLKDNLGGLVQTGIEVANLFLTRGETVIYTVGRDPQVQKRIIADTAPVITNPVIVLVNNRTASASEIVASALHDNCKAIVVGERTFGKIWCGSHHWEVCHAKSQGYQWKWNRTRFPTPSGSFTL
ncbi:carboxyl-terminal-processing peptidase 1, chloroplastic-like isoform X2 [Asparagus officinalis]|uniref:carboxyl-terminal-processing peptidase 1, chloroplastic-like isoform X2 n=1 Tax=Asparagus officinalis TaxID=4686 RepID=UPI00098E068D|nr:carboxyl-terminal-processing peptidase 1, chloroplastic-like isoform X2 [Asparagus officinalis]